MNKELQDLAWRVLPKDFKDFVPRKNFKFNEYFKQTL